MANHDFTPLYERFGDVITELPEEFTSHQFIQALARRNQVLYIEALHSYRNTPYKAGQPAPFMMVHGILAKHLQTRSEIEQIADNVLSTDIFGQANECAMWRKR